MLTDRQIKGLRPTTKHQYIADGHGLYLRVHPSGKRQFLLRSRVGGKASWVPLGDYPTLTLQAARERARGVVSTDSVADIYPLFDRAFLAKYKRPDISRSRFNLDILPVLGGMKAMDVTRQDVFRVLQRPLDRDAPVAANRTLADLHHFFDFCVQRGYIGTDPTLGISRKFVGGKEQTRAVTLEFDTLPTFLALLRSGKHMHVCTAAALYLVLLTALRPSEVLGIMRMAPSGREVTINDAKTDKPHRVYLCPQTRAILRAVRGLPVPGDHRNLSRALRRAGAAFTPHDLRRTAATRMADLGVMPHVTEKILNHEMEGVMAVYNRAEFWPERVAAYRLWGRTLAMYRRKKRPDEPGA